MKDNILRFLSNVKRNSQIASFIKSIFDEFSSKDISTSQLPIPNQALPPLQGNDGMSAIQFYDQPYFNFEAIREIDHIFSTESKNPSSPIEFYCTGYLDNDKDIVITDVVSPALSEAIKRAQIEIDPNNLYEILNNPEYIKKLKTAYDSLLANPKEKSDLHIETTANLYDFLRETELNTQFGSKLVGLFGKTKHSTGNTDTSNCFKLQEVSESIIPFVPVKSKILSGAISITPKTISIDAVNQKDKDNWLKNGSIECLVADYTTDRKGYVKANRLYNIARAFHKDKPLLISSSAEPIHALKIPQYDDENEMETEE